MSKNNHSAGITVHRTLFLISISVLLISPRHIAATPAPAAGDEALTAAATYVQKAIKAFPQWESDDLAPYEQPEIAAVKADIAICLSPSTKNDAEFLEAVRVLRADFATLVALDGVLQNSNLI